MIVNSATKALQIAAPALKEAAPEALKKAAPFVPVVGSAYGFGLRSL